MEQNKDQSGAVVRGKAVAEAKTTSIQHDSDCSLHNMPAYPAGPCDCTAKKVKPDFATDEEWSLMGHQVEGSQNGIDWFAGELVEIIDLFVPYRVNINGEPLLFQQIRPVIKVSVRAADAPSEPSELLAELREAARNATISGNCYAEIMRRAADALDSQPTDDRCAECGLHCKAGACIYGQPTDGGVRNG